MKKCVMEIRNDKQRQLIIALLPSILRTASGETMYHIHPIQGVFAIHTTGLHVTLKLIYFLK